MKYRKNHAVSVDSWEQHFSVTVAKIYTPLQPSRHVGGRQFKIRPHNVSRTELHRTKDTGWEQRCCTRGTPRRRPSSADTHRMAASVDGGVVGASNTNADAAQGPPLPWILGSHRRKAPSDCVDAQELSLPRFRKHNDPSPRRLSDRPRVSGSTVSRN